MVEVLSLNHHASNLAGLVLEDMLDGIKDSCSNNLFDIIEVAAFFSLFELLLVELGLVQFGTGWGYRQGLGYWLGHSSAIRRVLSADVLMRLLRRL